MCLIFDTQILAAFFAFFFYPFSTIPEFLRKTEQHLQIFVFARTGRTARNGMRSRMIPI